MSIPRFSEDEVTRLSENVFIHKPKHDGCGYRVYLKVDHQYFRIHDHDGDGFEELEDAQFLAAMLQKAVDRLLTQ